MLKIGNLEIKYRAMLAPMASLTDVAFRRLLDEIGGAGLMATEMISAEGVKRRNRKTLEMIRAFDFKTPQFIQLFGAQPEPFIEAVKYVESETDFCGVDINMGCPANKVIKKGAGAKLLADPPQIGRIIRAARGSTSLPLTVKIRLGYAKIDVFEIVKILENEGVDAVTVHFRRKSDKYSQAARWEYAPLIKETCRIVLIGNGDIATAADAEKKLQVVDGVMIGRGAVAHPLIFREISHEPSPIGDMRAVLDRLMELIQEYYEPMLRLPRLKAFTRFLAYKRTHCKKARQKIYNALSFEEGKKYFKELYDPGPGI